ncbi:MAG: hypothetical protein WCP28_09255 [Actinomycetes bacterium]
MADLSGLEVSRIGPLLGPEASGLVVTYQREEVFSDQDVLAALRAAAETVGEPLSHAKYDGVSQAVGGPSSVRIIQRFWTWRTACQSAGVQAGAGSGRRYQRRWTEDDALGWVAQYLRSADARGTFADFDRWARTTPGAPSANTVRNIFGAWSAAKRSALQTG